MNSNEHPSPALLWFTLLAAFLWIATGPVLAQVQAVPPGKPLTTPADWKLAGFRSKPDGSLEACAYAELADSGKP